MNSQLHAGENGGDDRALGNLYHRLVLDDLATGRESEKRHKWEAK